MSQVYFCATDFYLNGGYRSYVDFFDLARFAGYPVISVSAIDPQSDNTYIFTPANGETVAGWPGAKAQIILWQLEWQLTDEHNTPPGVRRVWASDASFAKQRGYEYIPIGSDDRLNPFNLDALTSQQRVAMKDRDAVFLSYQTPRRQVVSNAFKAAGLSLAAEGGGLLGAARSSELLRARVMVHVHQHESIRTIAPLRWALAAAHQLPLITEMVDDPGIFGPLCMFQYEYKDIAQWTKSTLQYPQLLEGMAAVLHGLLCREHTFRKVVEANV